MDARFMSNDELIARHQILGQERIKMLQLIAAAPDLLEANTTSLAAMLYVQQAVEGGQDFGMSLLNAAILKAQAALDKATV